MWLIFLAGYAVCGATAFAVFCGENATEIRRDMRMFGVLRPLCALLLCGAICALAWPYFLVGSFRGGR